MRKTHTACVVVFRNHPVTGRPEFLVMEYQSTDPKTKILSKKETRFVAGTNRSYPWESAEDTAIRKLLQETGLVVTKERLRPIGYEFAGRGHIKFGYLVNFDECQGELRHTEVTIDGDVMSHPFWNSLPELDHGVISKFHQWLYNLACDNVLSQCA